MKYALYVLIALLSLSCSGGKVEKEQTSAAAEKAESPDIQLEVAEMQPGGIAYLIALSSDQQYRLDSAQIQEGGKVRFQREEPYPQGLVFAYFPDRTTIQLMVTADQTFSLQTNNAEVVTAMQVDGSTENELLYRNLKFEVENGEKIREVMTKMSVTREETAAYQQFKAEEDRLLAERKQHLEELFEEYPNSFFTTFKRAGQNPEARDVRLPDGSVDKKRQVYLYRQDFWEGVDFSDERLLRTPVIHNKLKRYFLEMTPQHPDSLIAAADFLIEKVDHHPAYYQFFTNWVALQYDPNKSAVMDAEAVLVHMIQNYFTYQKAFWADSSEVYALQMRANEMAGSLIGNKAPDVKAPDPSGKQRAISDIDAPYIVVFMYNPDCDHCIEQTPKLVRFYRQWKPRGLEVYAIALDTDDRKWKQFIAKNGMDWVNVFDPTNRAFYGKYYVDNTPEIYVLNPERTIIGKNLKVDQIASIIQRDQS